MSEAVWYTGGALCRYLGAFDICDRPEQSITHRALPQHESFEAHRFRLVDDPKQYDPELRKALAQQRVGMFLRTAEPVF